MSNSFRQMLASKIIKRTDNGQFIGLADIHEKPGFNKRDKDADWEAGIQELVAFLDAGGEVPPIEVHARDDGGVWIVEGHRRTEAYRRLAAKGKPVEWIHIKQFNGNDAERIARIATSNSQSPLKPLERAAVYAELRALNWSNDDIARRMGKDAEHVKRHLDLIDAPAAVQAMVKSGEVSATTAVRQTRKHGEKAAEVLQQELQSAQKQGKRKVTGGTIGKAKKPATTVPDGMVLVPVESLKAIRRDLDACQSVIHYAGGFDPAYVSDAQARLREIDELMALAGAA